MGMKVNGYEVMGALAFFHPLCFGVCTPATLSSFLSQPFGSTCLFWSNPYTRLFNVRIAAHRR